MWCSSAHIDLKMVFSGIQNSPYIHHTRPFIFTLDDGYDECFSTNIENND